MPPPYVDTSALAKWFFVEPRSEEFVAFIQKAGKGAISTLTRLEFHSLAYRRLRTGEIDRSYLADVFSSFESLVERTVLIIHQIQDAEFVEAGEIVRRLGSDLPLKTLDVLHIAAALRSRATSFATADRQLAALAEKVGLTVIRFD